MFRHIVLVRFQPEADAEQRRAVRDALEAMRAAVLDIVASE